MTIQPGGAVASHERVDRPSSRLDWYQQARFGLFIHCGAYALAGMEASWPIIGLEIAADPTTQTWWKLTDPCQVPLESRQPGEWWASMEEFSHAD